VVLLEKHCSNSCDSAFDGHAKGKCLGTKIILAIIIGLHSMMHINYSSQFD
jgi:hypothetical protein